MKKKAQGLSVNTIIIAAVALIVLVVLVAIFTGRLGIFTKGVEDCLAKGGSCDYTEKKGCPSDTHTRLPGAECKDTGKICCIPIKSK